MLLGYAALKQLYNLPDIPHYVTSHLVRGARRTVNDQEYYPYAYQPEASLFGQLEFALKYEGINLTILSALFTAVAEMEWIVYVQLKPTSAPARRVWFLYEFLLDKKMNIPDLSSTCGYVDLLDNERYVTRQGKKVVRYRVNNNLLGSRNFCPMVRRTAFLQNSSWEQLRDSAELVIRAYDAETIHRAVSYLYTKETRSTFAIEHETPPQTKIERFGLALQSVRAHAELNKRVFLDLQNILLDEKAAATDYRTEQNYVGETLGHREIIHFIPPKPDDVPALMSGLIDFCQQSQSVDPIIAAAIAAFGFVFIHPFEDGNGRIHRYIAHHFLVSRGVTPHQVIFPLSATMLNHLQAYDACLESFSKSIMPLIQYQMYADLSLKVLNNTAEFYRYFDATQMCEYLYECVSLTIENELKAELDIVFSFAQARAALESHFDLPEKKKNLLLKLCWQGKGVLSESKRASHFSEYTDLEISERVAVVAPFFRSEK